MWGPRVYWFLQFSSRHQQHSVSIHPLLNVYHAQYTLVRYMTPPFGMYTALSAQLAGSLRHSHSRLAEFAEEVAFLKGEETEKMLLERDYATVLKHENRVLQRRWWFGCVEEGVIKWLWGSFGVSCDQMHGAHAERV